MKEIRDIISEKRKRSTGIFKEPNGNIFYLENGEYHRVNGPAMVFKNGTEKWLFHGKYHKSDGYAISYANGIKALFYYGNYADNKVIFYNSIWRRKIEITEFL